MDGAANLSPNQKRQLYELCWQFEEAWEKDNSIKPKDWASKLDSIDSDLVLSELIETWEELTSNSKTREQFSNAQAERYEFIEEIARGGAAIIWRVYDRHLQRQSAVKYLMDSQDNSQMRSRLRREARICAKLVHPGIVPIHELSSFEDGRPFVCMKLIEGKTLLQLLKSDPPLSSQRWFDIFMNACQAMAYAHDKEVIHRDLTPSNIMVGSFGEVQIMDWGLAKDLAKHHIHTATEEDSASMSIETPGYGAAPTVHHIPSGVTKMDMETTRVGSVFGTIAYLSPEQALGHVDQIDKRSDVFSLGAILCRLLTDASPYHHSDQDELLARARKADLSDAIRRLSKARNRLLAELAIRCLSPDPEARPKDAGELVKRLERIKATMQYRKTALTWMVATTLVVALVFLSFFRPAPWFSTTALPAIKPSPAPMVTDPEAIYSLLNAGQEEVVLSSYRAALDKHPKDLKLHFTVGSFLRRIQRLQEAEEVVKQLVRCDPTYPEHHFLLGDILYQQGRFQEALDNTTQAKVRRDNGAPCRLPIDERLAEFQRSFEISKRIDALTDRSKMECSPSEYLEVGEVFDVRNDIELAIKFYRLGLEEKKNLRERSVKMFLLQNYFIHRKLSRTDLSTKQRNLVCEVGLEWANAQLSFVASEFGLGEGAKDEEAARMKQELVRELKNGITFQCLSDSMKDSSINSNLKAEISNTLDEISKL